MTHILAITTAPSRDSARKLAEALVQGKLAACVNIVGGVESVFSWKGVIQTEKEHVLLIKTLEEKLQSIKESIKENHPYEVPELLVFKASEGLEAYLRWMSEVIQA